MTRIAAAVVLAVLPSSLVVAAQEESPLFRALSVAADAPAGALPGAVLRSRSVAVAFEQLEAMREAGAGRLTLNLFDDVLLVAEITEAGDTHTGYGMTGRLDGDPLSVVSIGLHGAAISGTVISLDGSFEFIGTADRTVISEVDPDLLPPDGLLDPEPAADPDPETRREDGNRVDIAIAYTALATATAGSEDALKARAIAWLRITNLALQTGPVHTRLNLAGWIRMSSSYRESFDMANDLRRITNDPWIRELRDEHHIDLVAMLVGPVDDNWCGLAWFRPLHERNGFSVTRIDCGGNNTFAHEIGHNFGMSHDRYQVALDRGSLALALQNTNYSFGFVNGLGLAPGRGPRRWYTVMAYGTRCYRAGYMCVRLPYFSNPRQVFNGERFGVPGNFLSFSVDGPADGVRMLNATRATIANYRARPVDPPEPPRPPIPTVQTGEGIKAGTLTQIRALVDWARGVCGLGASRWTDPRVVAGQTAIRAEHVTEPRRALEEAHVACSLAPPRWTDPVITRGRTPVRAVHFAEIIEVAQNIEADAR